MTPSRQVWRERLNAPVSWWLLGAGLVVTLVWIVWVVAPGMPAAVAGAVAGVAVVATLLALGSTVVAVEALAVEALAVEGAPGGGVLVAGRGRLSSSVMGDVTPLDAAQLRRLAGVDADARAFLVLPPFVSTAVRVDLVDPKDPTPYWLVATRHPQRLAAVVDAVRLAAPCAREGPRPDPVTD